jgi:hypothetical protein
MKKFIIKFCNLNILISIISLLLAIATTFFLGTFALLGTLFGIMSIFRGEFSLDGLMAFFYGFFGLIGICGLWLRSAQPFLKKSPFLSTSVAVALFIGAISALGMVYIDLKGSFHPIIKNITLSDFGKAMLGLAMIAIAIASYNISTAQTQPAAE